VTRNGPGGSGNASETGNRGALGVSGLKPFGMGTAPGEAAVVSIFGGVGSGELPCLDLGPFLTNPLPANKPEENSFPLAPPLAGREGS